MKAERRAEDAERRAEEAEKTSRETADAAEAALAAAQVEKEAAEDEKASLLAKLDERTAAATMAVMDAAAAAAEDARVAAREEADAIHAANLEAFKADSEARIQRLAGELAEAEDRAAVASAEAAETRARRDELEEESCVTKESIAAALAAHEQAASALQEVGARLRHTSSVSSSRHPAAEKSAETSGE